MHTITKMYMHTVGNSLVYIDPINALLMNMYSAENVYPSDKQFLWSTYSLKVCWVNVDQGDSIIPSYQYEYNYKWHLPQK